MTVSRVLFLAKYRVPHAAFAMQFDHNLQGIDCTKIATPMTRDELEPVLDHNHCRLNELVAETKAAMYQLLLAHTPAVCWS